MTLNVTSKGSRRYFRRRGIDDEVMAQHQIDPIDMVVLIYIHLHKQLPEQTALRISSRKY